MRAAILDKYGKQGRSLTIADVPIPEIENGEVLVKVRTAGVNPLDNMIVRGEVKLIAPYTMPLVMGNEFCGSIVKMGGEVRGFSIGERVYGRLPLKRVGAFAEKRIPASVDDVFGLDNVNQALKKVASGGSKGKTILKINS